MTTPTTVLYLDHTAKISGGEIALLRLIRALDRTLVTPIVLLGEDGPLMVRLTDAGIETHVMPLDPSISQVRKDTLGLGALKYATRLMSLIRYSRRVARFARERNVDILHTNSLKADIYGAFAARLCRKPVVWHVRDHIDPSYLPRPAVFLFRAMARILPNYILTNSQSTLDHLLLHNARRAVVVPSGVVVNRFVVHDGIDPNGLEYGHGHGHGHGQTICWDLPICIGIVGRIAKWKGQHIFLEAGAQLIEAGWDLSLIIIGAPLFGEDAYASELSQFVDKKGISDRVHFLGFCEDVQAEIRKLDILVHASISPEPFGQVVIEGMIESIPVIGTDGGGVSEIIQHGETGILVPMGDAGALVRELKALLEDPEKAHTLGAAGRRHVVENFTVEQTARKVEAVYEEILHKR